MCTGAEYDAATQRIVDAIAKRIAPEETSRLLRDAVAVGMKSIEINEHERPLAELEKAAVSVDLPGLRR